MRLAMTALSTQNYDGDLPELEDRYPTVLDRNYREHEYSI